MQHILGMPDGPHLGGEVKAVFTYVKAEELEAAIEKARLEQEEICGYALTCTTTRMTHVKEAITGRDIYEVYATFAPCTLP